MHSPLTQRIETLHALGRQLQQMPEIQTAIATAERYNPWFTPRFVSQSIQAIGQQMLHADKLNEWLRAYPMHEVPKTIGLVFAGNIPLVGFHDFLCAYVCGCNMVIKLSSKDEQLFPAVLQALGKADPTVHQRVQLVEKLTGFDAVIATGSDNTNRYFEYYFRNYPNLLRRNRNSVALLTGQETNEELRALADDVCMYFGLGCRNVSKIYVPRGYDVANLLPHFEPYLWMHQHNRYMSNYDYQRTLLLLNKTPHTANDIVMLVENEAIASPLATLHYTYYDNMESALQNCKTQADKIQCIAASVNAPFFDNSRVPLGQTQQPRLSDYADGVDTVQFLLGL